MKKEKLTSQIKELYIEQCKEKLLKLRYGLINQIKTTTEEFNHVDKSRGDESDLSAAHQEEHNFVIKNQRMKNRLVEINLALARIESGNYGICEETEELIEIDRLLAIPWTRLSIEGAEARESRVKKNGKVYLSTL